MITQTHLQNLFMGPQLRLGERCPCKAEAPGSNPGGSIYKHVIVCLIGAAYILTDDNKNVYVTINSYDGDEKNVIIPSSIENYPVKEIGGNCFSNINKVESITVPDSVVAIGDFAFFGCPNLTKVVIPSSVKKIGAAINSGSHFTIYGESGSYAEEYTLHPEKHTCTEPIPFEPINSKD